LKSKFVILILAVCGGAPAQSTSGYVFFAPGGVSSHGYTSMTMHVGGGVDAHVARAFGANVELGALALQNDLLGAMGVLSLGPTYHFTRRRDSRVEPFAAGGYSLMFRDGHRNLFYFGGGVNYWATRSLGLRLEFRDHVSNDPAHFWSFRFDVAFR
jgi:hypothetical protein